MSHMCGMCDMHRQLYLHVRGREIIYMYIVRNISVVLDDNPSGLLQNTSVTRIAKSTPVQSYT